MTLQLFDLLGRGYFPKELPPPFTTEGFAKAMAGVGAVVPSGVFTARPKFSECCTHNLVRTGGLRRNLGIPNPKHFYRLAFVVVVPATDPQLAKLQLSDWIEKNPQIVESLTETDVICSVIYSGRGCKHEYQVRRKCIESHSTANGDC